MLRSGTTLGGRFRIVREYVTDTCSIAAAEDAQSGARAWLVSLTLDVDAAVLASTLERELRFTVGVPALARPLTSGVDRGTAFVVYVAPSSESVAEVGAHAWAVARVAKLVTRLADALAPLHDQGIAHGLIRSELVTESEAGDVLYGFGVAALATRFGFAGEASQLLPPEYRAPELRAALVPPTPSSDAFALGVLARRLLLGAESAEKTPFAPELEQLFSIVLAPDPRARLNDVRAFARELTRLAESARAVAPDAGSLPYAPSAHEDDAVLAAPLQAMLPDSPLPTPHGVEVPPTQVEPSPFAPPGTHVPKPSNATAWIALLVVGFGFLLLFGGATAGMVYAVRHAPRTSMHRARTSVAPPPVMPAPAPSPKRELVPGPSDFPPPMPTSSPPKSVSKAPISHAPLVPPGVGPSSFPEEAHAAMPVLGSEPIWGTRNAPLTWVLFGDLECPHTRRAWRALEAAKTTFGDDLRIVFRHRPLREHPYALEAARVLAGLAKTRGSAAFFRVLHRIAQNEQGLSDERLLTEITAAGYSDVGLAALASAGESAVADDLELAGQFAVRATPLSFVNGVRVEGERTPDELERLLLDERRAATWLLAGGTSAKDFYVTRTSGNLIGVGEQDATRVCVPLGDAPARGPADALVTLVEFSDFECPYCKQVEPALQMLLARYPRTLRLVWKDYPLPQHKGARLLANFAAEAGSLGASAGFWRVHDGLFARAGEIDESVLGELAGKAGLDGTLLLSAARAGSHDAAIHADVALGERLGVNGTPTFFANGRRVQGALALDRFDELIRSELASASRIVAHGVPKEKLYGLTCDGSD